MPGLILALPANARFMSVKNIDTKTSITKGYKAVYYIFISATSVCYYEAVRLHSNKPVLSALVMYTFCTAKLIFLTKNLSKILEFYWRLNCYARFINFQLSYYFGFCY